MAQISPLRSIEYQRRFEHERGEVVTTLKRLAQVERLLSDSPVLIFDYETTGTRWFAGSKACGIALGGLVGGQLHTFYLPYRHRTGEEQLPEDAVIAVCARLYSRPVLKIGHNLKFDLHFGLLETGLDQIPGGYFDTMIAAYLYDENFRLGLKPRAERDLGEVEKVKLSRELDDMVAILAKQAGGGKQAYLSRVGYSETSIYLCGFYACYDVEFTYRLFLKYVDWGIMDHHRNIFHTEMNVLRALVDMEEYGQEVDADYLFILSQKLSAQMDQLRLKFRDKISPSFNAGSDKQVRDLLYGFYGLTTTALTKKKQPAVDRKALEPFIEQYPIVGDILKYRDAEKTESTYCTGILELIDQNSVLHPDFQQVGTATGRLSCRSPNFQNISKDRSENDENSIRKAFTVPNGFERYYLDYSQVELRVIAWYAQDENMIETFKNDGDIHTLTATQVFDYTEELKKKNPTEAKTRRNRAKILNFGISFGMTEFGFARNTGMSLDEGRAFIKKFDKQFPGIDRFRQELYENMRKNGGQFRNPFGRMRRIKEIFTRDEYARGRAERQAISSAVQGTAAELTKASLARTWQFIQNMGLRGSVFLSNTIHDEIQYDIRVSDQNPKIVAEIKRIMEDFPLFDPIPIKVDVEKSVTNWSDKKDYTVKDYNV